jgi:hypothetical protein
MHARQSREQKGTHFTNTGTWQMRPLAFNVKTTSCAGMQSVWLKRTSSHLDPDLGSVVANIGTYSRASAYTLARACASAL